MKRFFVAVAAVLAEVNPILAEKLQRASPHWMRHCHASHALDADAVPSRSAGMFPSGRVR